MLSVIIPTLNESEYLPELLKYLKYHVPDDSEIIVADGHSSDGTASIAATYGCTVVSDNTRKPAVQRNSGARISHGDVFLFVDADTRFDGDALRESLKEFTSRKLDVASFYFDFDSRLLRYRLLHAYGSVLIYLLHFFHPVALGAAILVKKSWFEASGGFDESVAVGEDHLFAYKIRRSGGRYGLLRKPHVYFSLRRFYKEGFFTVIYKWHYFAWYYARHGAFSKSIVPYEFGSYTKDI